MVEEPEGHHLSDEVYQKIIQLLWIFESQLQITADRSQVDYDTIMEFCLEQINGDHVDIDKRHKVVSALQYRDRYIQRNDHVVNRMKQLIFHMLRKDWEATADELNHEMSLARSWYNEKELEKFQMIAKGYCELEVLDEYIEKSHTFDDDLDLFD